MRRSVRAGGQHILGPNLTRFEERSAKSCGSRFAVGVANAYRTEKQHETMLQWVLTAETMLHVDDWIKLFLEAGYTSDYYWWIVEKSDWVVGPEVIRDEQQDEG